MTILLRRLGTGLALLGLSVLAACGIEYAPPPGEDGARAPAPARTDVSSGGDRDSGRPSRPNRY